MRLIRLSANQSSFRTVVFNPTGISLITAEKRTEDNQNTYNSVGKSLCVALVHFCLGSNPVKGFEEKLQEWTFTLEFDLNGTIHKSSRSTNNQNVIVLDENEFTLKEFNKKMGEQVFGLLPRQQEISFRSLISRFIRPKKSSYNSYDEFIKEEQPYNRLLNNAYLLGLDISLVERKFQLNKDLKESTDAKRRIEKDSTLREFFQYKDDKDAEVEIVNLEERIAQLSRDLEKFVVAENYTTIQREADEISARLREKRNETVIVENSIAAIEKSLNIQPDIPFEKVKRLYEEAQVSFSDLVVKRLEDLEIFNHKLLNDRRKRLLEERQKFESRLKDLNAIIKRLSEQEDEKLQYLNSHGALDDYVQLTNQLASLKSKLEKLNGYKKMVKEYNLKTEQLKQEISQENINTEKYLEDNDLIRRKNILLFKSFAERFYGSNRTVGISIESNPGENTIRFNISAKIQDDAGDAVGEVKLFCFDWTILKGEHNHSVKLIFHDSKILDGVDTRQIAAMFRIAGEECERSGVQYIISANHYVLQGLREELTEEEYQRLITDSIVMQLSDASDADKLLGIQVDLDYK